MHGNTQEKVFSSDWMKKKKQQTREINGERNCANNLKWIIHTYVGCESGTSSTKSGGKSK